MSLSPGTVAAIEAGVPDNVVALPAKDEGPEEVEITLQKADVVRMVLGTDAPWAPASHLITMERDFVRGREIPTWNRKALEAMPLQSLLKLYSDINWEHENPLGASPLIVPHR
jgi:hypothetical protein